MQIVHRLVVALRALFQFDRVEREFDEELRFHLARQIQANLEAGMGQRDAVREAHLSLGGFDQIHEVSRERRTGALARQVLKDLQYGLRLLRRSPGFAAAGIGIVALGIGAVTAIFSVVYGVVLRPLPYPDPNRLVTLSTVMPQLGRASVNAADHRDWQAGNDVFEDIAVLRPFANFNLIGAGEPERLQAARVSSNLFAVLGVQPIAGRWFTEAEDEIGNDRVVILSHALWRRRFEADRTLVGRTINLSGVPHVVVGVMPPSFQFPSRDFQIWTPLTINPNELSRKEPGFNFRSVARLKPGVSLARAQSQIDAIAKRIAIEYPATNRDVGVAVDPMLEDTTRTVRPALYVLLGAVGCLLLIACLNLANLLAARAAGRAREFAVRKALGASRGRLTMQALAETVPLLVLGGALGVAAAAAGVRAFIPLAPPELPRLESIAMSRQVLAVSIALLAVTGIVAGLIPAARAWGASVVDGFQGQGRSTAGGRRQTNTRNLLVISQLALVLPLLVGAGLLTRSFVALTNVDPGFRPDNVLTLHLAIARTKYRGDPAVAAFCTRVVERLSALPGVRSVGMVNRLPLGGVAQVLNVELEGTAAGTPPVGTDSRSVTPLYFQTMGIPLIEGRVFTEHDRPPDLPESPSEFPVRVAIVDQRLARTVWPGQSAVGKRLRIPLGDFPWIEIVGVVGHIRNDGLDVDPRPQIYFSYLERAQDRMVAVVRGTHDAGSLKVAVVQALRSLDSETPVYDVRTMDEVVERSMASRWLNMVLVTVFAVMAVVLAAIGVYGVVAYGVAEQIREFGIRMALGADRRTVIELVLRKGALFAGVGAAAGLAGSLAATRAMQSLLYGIAPNDPVTFAVAVAAMFGIVLVASYVPARRAAAVDPAVVLRAE